MTELERVFKIYLFRLLWQGSTGNVILEEHVSDRTGQGIIGGTRWEAGWSHIAWIGEYEKFLLCTRRTGGITPGFLLDVTEAFYS